jgi:hypothetical protein
MLMRWDSDIRDVSAVTWFSEALVEIELVNDKGQRMLASEYFNTRSTSSQVKIFKGACAHFWHGIAHQMELPF